MTSSATSVISIFKILGDNIYCFLLSLFFFHVPKDNGLDLPFSSGNMLECFGL